MASKSKQEMCDSHLSCAGRILKMQQWTDCSFLVGVDGTVVRAHKLILAMVSPVFEAMFYGPLAEAEGPISIPDMEPLAFNAMLEFIYTDTTDIKTYILAIDLVYAAQKYMVPRLLTLCTKYLSKNLTPDNVCRIYELAIFVGDKQLLNDCEQMIMAQPAQVLNSKSFLKLNLDTVESMYKLPMNLDNEIPLIQAAKLYNESFKARSVDFDTSLEVLDCLQDLFGSQVNDYNKSTKESVATSGTEACIQEKKVGGSRHILKVLRQIHFLSLTPQELGEEKSMWSLLTGDEIAAILVNAVSDDGKASVPMPDGFSTSRTRRNEVTTQQVNYLLDYMKENPSIPDFAEDCDNVEEYMNHWSQLKTELDTRGPPRTIEEWQVLWIEQQEKGY